MKKANISIVILTILMALSSCQKKSSEKEILSFRFVSPDVQASIEGRNIIAMVPFDTDVTDLTPVILVSEGATVTPGSGVPMDFTQPVSYTVIAEDGSQAVYTAMVFVKEISNEKQIFRFRFDDLDMDATIDESTKEITATVPEGTDVSALEPTISISAGATIDPASGVATDFTQPVIYTVTAEDGSQSSYNVIVTIELPENPFLGVWGVEKLEYFNTDYAGNPIASTISTFLYDPYSTDNGVQFYFREDNSGEMRDSAIEELWLDWNDETHNYDTHIVCPDTVLVKSFTYSYNDSQDTLYVNMDNGDAYRLVISNLSNEAFVYECVYAQNGYGNNYVEKAYLRRVNFAMTKSTGKSMLPRPHKMHGSLLGDR